MELIQHLLIVYAGILTLNVALSAVLWAKQRTALLRNLFLVWATACAAFVSQGVASGGTLATVYGFAPVFATNLSMAFLLARIVDITFPWRFYVTCFAAGCALSPLLHLAGAPFWLVALPVSLPAGLPSLGAVVRAVRSRLRTMTVTVRALSLTCVAFSLHNIDFAFLRDKPDFAAPGFTIAIILTFALGTTAPAAVLERVALERARAEELERFKSKLFANITHELKTPLTMMLTPLGLLIDGELGPVSEAHRATLESMSKHGAKLLKLIGDILDLTKLEESRLRLRVAEHDIVSYLRGLLSQTESLAHRKQLKLSFSSEADSIGIFCDIERIERVFVNLLSNAYKFTPQGGAVSVRIMDQGPSILIEVEDTGAGFPSEFAERLFDRFFQVDAGDTRKYGGTGIGLALAKELVELHGGRIWAVSEVGQGSTFSVRLLKGSAHFDAAVLDRRNRASGRLAHQHEGGMGVTGWHVGLEDRLRFIDIDQATEQRVVERDPDESERQHSVLVVEDTQDVVRVIDLALHEHFRIFAASNGVKGLELALKRRPTLVITDLMMPEMDGLELTRRLRADARTRHIPVIMLTARDDPEDRVEGLEAGVNAYLTKPFVAKELLSTMRSLLKTQNETADLVLSRQSASLESITGGLAHEIRNPLNYIKNALASVQLDAEKLVELVQAGRVAEDAESAKLERLVARMQKLFATADSGVKRIAGTVDLMARYSRDGYSRQPQPCNAFSALEDIIAILVPATGSDAEIGVSFEGDGHIEMVPDELNQALSNVIQNALEAVAPGQGHVFVRGWVEDSDVLISVGDDGPGICPEDQSRLFTPFFTTKDAGRGMGMGLTIARRCIVAAGGTISVKSQPGVGTEFLIRLPQARAHRQAPLVTAQDPEQRVADTASA
jgi:signal transduction histidine kinase